jgi:hypothetical protein
MLLWQKKFDFIQEKATNKFTKHLEFGIKEQDNEVNSKKQKPKNSFEFTHPTESPFLLKALEYTETLGTTRSYM